VGLLFGLLLMGFVQDAAAQGRQRTGQGAGAATASKAKAKAKAKAKNKKKAAARAPQAGRVAVRLMVVAATDSHDRTDPSLRPLLKHLQFLRYRGYELLDTHRAELAVDSETSFSIQGDRRVGLELIRKTPERVQFRVQVHRKGGKLLDTTLTVSRNGTFIVAGPRYRDGILILPLTVKY
jgi:hypothetical protein